MASIAQAQTATSIVWETLGLADETPIISGTDFTAGGATLTVDWTLATDGGVTPTSSGNYISYEGGTRGGQTGNLELGFNNDAFDLDDQLILDLDFDTRIEDLVFSVLDIDRSATIPFHDTIEVYIDLGYGAGLQNAATDFTANWTLGGASVSLDNETYLTGWEGRSNAGSTSPAANVDFDFTGSTVKAIRIVFMAGDDVAGDPGTQQAHVSDMSFTVPPAPVQFACDGTLYQVASNPSELRRLNFNFSGGAYSASLTTVGVGPDDINAGWGYSEIDDLIYGTRSGSKELWRVDANGTFTYMSELTYAGAPNSQYAGDVLPDGTLVFRASGTEWERIDISDPYNPTYISTITLTSIIDAADFAYNPFDSKLYGVDALSNQLFYIDISGTGALTRTPQFFGPTTYSDAYGAGWFDENANFFIWANFSNDIYMVDVGVNGSGTGEQHYLTTSSSDEGSKNDGAYCRGPAPIALAGISGTIYEDEDGSDILDGAETGLGSDILVELYLENNTPSDQTDDTLYKNTQTDADGDYAFGNLAVNDTFRVEVDETDTDIPAALSSGTLNPLTGQSLTGGSTTLDVDFGFEVSNPELVATKTVTLWDPDASGLYAIPGNDVIYTINVVNTGTTTVDSDAIELIDALPSESTFWNGDVEAGSAFDNYPGSEPVSFEQTGAGLSFSYATDVRYATGTTKPANFAACTVEAVTASYRSDLTFICINPKGEMLSGPTDPEFSVHFRAGIK